MMLGQVVIFIINLVYVNLFVSLVQRILTMGLVSVKQQSMRLVI
jgi:hypothetical protein